MDLFDPVRPGLALGADRIQALDIAERPLGHGRHLDVLGVGREQFVIDLLVLALATQFDQAVGDLACAHLHAPLAGIGSVRRRC